LKESETIELKKSTSEIKEAVKECIVVQAKGINSPYFAYGRAYIRVGESDKRLSVAEIESRILSKKRLFWEKEQSAKLCFVLEILKGGVAG